MIYVNFFSFILLSSFVVSCQKAPSQKVQSGLVEQKPEALSSLKAEIIPLSETFPYHLIINERVSTVSSAESLVDSTIAPDGFLYLLSNIKHNDSSSNYVYYSHLTRYTPQGEKDMNFGLDGKIKLHSSWGNREHLTNMSLVQDQMKLFGHHWHIQEQSYYAAAASVDLINQQMDLSFGNSTEGYHRLKINNRTYGIDSLTLSNGDTLSLIAVNESGEHPLYLLKFKDNGLVDTSFGTNGLLTLPVKSLYYWYISLATDAQDNIYVSYLRSESGSYHSSILKLLSSGERDPLFGEDGIVHLTLGTGSYGVSLLQDKDTLYYLGSAWLDGQWGSVLLSLSSVTGEIVSEFEIKTQDGEICQSGGFLPYREFYLVQCGLVPSKRNTLLAFRKDGTQVLNFAPEGILDFTSQGYSNHNLLLDNQRQILWLIGTLSRSGDLSQTILPVQLQYIPR